MFTHHFGVSPTKEFYVFVNHLRDREKTNVAINPKNGYLGVFASGDKLKITVSVSPDCKHECFTLDTKRTKTPKKDVGLGIYEKSLTITISDSGGYQVAPWPANLLGLNVKDRSFNIGLFNQKGIFYLDIEEYLPDIDKDFLPGEVKWFSLLRGMGSVSSGNFLFDRRIHWSNTPSRSNGLRYLNTGEILEVLEVAIKDSSTSFRQEITKSYLKS